ncbi:unnamed protein product [Didymodactylos carnosus]|uniref:Uncharacterized protein n=1 Tax=Didymodactylos carnosus TaxID=1234261 RepID=A0A813X5N6_9BILA|nr:unnamed protein product [Didymodactylos carnosus]CAF1484874.1 unnamed protein product [Didymodactylos carnosus]CAF3658258.1 unnamed protein product [Didymodactylos carnosus]CAF4274883.1 unnamed protein product [Didymodactylos carnosus]
MQNFKVCSNTFHKGCNTDDFITYCMRINKQTGNVSLIHAGANCVYNHTSLNYTFDKTELDLSRLEYVQVRAGSQTVAIQNITITDEPIDELHSSFDKQFNASVSTSAQNSNITTANNANKSQDTTPKTSWTDKIKDGIKEFFAFGNSNEQAEEAELLTPCRDSFLHQYPESNEHNTKYSHPCRFSELCHNIRDEQHAIQFTHKKQCIYLFILYLFI